MDSPSHTPGPWDLVEVRTSIGRAFRIGSGDMLAAGPGCCIIYDDYPGNLNNQRAANARLIAAAPDLLEALKLADAMLSGANMNASVIERKVRAAISKAEGRS